MLDALIDAAIDSLKLLPFLFLTYLVMEYIEHKTSAKAKLSIQKSGKFGPFIGSLLGIVPQCGFSAAAASLYAGRIITLGTLIAIFLSTSDEMIPILLSEAAPLSLIFKILGIKLLVGIFWGFMIDFILHRTKQNHLDASEIEHLCENDHCHCEHGMIKSSLKHTFNIFLYIFFITLLLNIIIGLIGEDALSHFISQQPFLGPILAGLIGLIPNCASSVILTKLYLSSLITPATLLSGLFVSAGVGLLILFKTNRDLKKNIQITILLYGIGVLSGLLLGWMGLQF